ncbi:LOW QUALITY PROTEIN: C3 and PZP-like alpha-2-macroglobulin domain-containing protein 8 [Nilaparvata lugens]|uniref:LOW QUALITY PROTEIN: C3 and PZP-like alpha-2-macroglobulin domain-containing protein 8 n=1 Tax=Nilaparvata lugens TaxID=108931 RepID=UPI00193EBB3B|nr:LOW QUALITY PROTEIN: C3 and PZP-like alpha-2-macroglobulin domain-containing protein 8 [Nilaparvata lugens]
MLPLWIPAHEVGDTTLQTIISCPGDGQNRSTLTNSPLRLVGAVRDVVIRPISKYYRPGETVEFWVLALDHDLRMVSDGTLGSVALLDPMGTKVTVWSEVALYEGVKHFSLPLSPLAVEGAWSLTVSVDARVFAAELNVSHARGSTDALLPELPIAEEHFVELRFSQEMRRRYKPGLPFVGKVEAVSSEQAVRVRVKVLDNTTAIYSQDIEMARGEGTFLVPAILSDSEVITLLAELVSVAGKETDSHYVLAKEPVLKWKSSSSCYLLIEGIEKTLQPNDEAHAVILSSCPCDRTFHHVITTEGHVTYWNQTDSMTDDQVPPPVSVDGAAICRINFTFKVEAVMAPVSHLLVYYITHEGEPVSDTISFDVNLLQRESSVNLERRATWYPGENMDVEVLAEIGTFACLVGGRGGDVRYQHRFVSESEDFTESGLVFLQQFCDMKANGTTCRITGQNKPDPSAMVRHSLMAHMNLEQIWYWKCFNYTPEIEATGLTIPAPQQPGKWSLSALLLPPSPLPGFRLSPPVTFNVFRPITVEFRLAPNIKVGEALEVDVKIGNNVNSCVDVNGLLSLSEGAHFTGVNQPLVAEKLRLGPQGATSLVVRVVATSPGIKNMTVQVSAVVSKNCQSTESGADQQNNSLVGTVIHSGTVLVYPEGLERKHTESAYFCANEQLMISTENNFQYEFLQAPRNRQNIVFEIRAGGSVHIALSDIQGVSDVSYVIVIGGSDNRLSWVTRGKHGYGRRLQSWSTPEILSEEESRTFWLSWESGTLKMGRGHIPYFNVFLQFKYAPKMRINFLGFATEWGRKADFRIWNYNDEAGFSQVLHLDVPRSVLPGSETGTLIINGGLSLLSISHILPRTPTLHTSLATILSQIAPLLASAAGMSNDTSELLHQHVQNLLSFRNADNSFGDHRNVSSHWNTLHVLQTLHSAQTYIGIDVDLISSIIAWIKKRQNSDGSFHPSAMDFTIRNATPANMIIQTTAETVAALLQIGIETEDDAETVLKARFYLEGCLYHDLDPVSLAMLSYALVLTESTMVPQAIEKLRKASTNEEGDFGWPHPADNSDWLYEEGGGQMKPQVLPNVIDYRASLYVLMTYSILPDLKLAEPVARYLFYRSHVLDKHTELVYTAMRAFTLYSSWAVDKHRQLTLSLATSGMELTDTLELRNTSVSQVLQLPSLPTKVFVYATGAGCATVQGHVSYTTYSPSKSNTLLEIWAGVEQETLPPRNSAQESIFLEIKVCVRWKGAANASGVLRAEVDLFSGFQLCSSPPTNDNLHYGAHDNKVWFTMTNVKTECLKLTACSVYMVSGLRPALASVYPIMSPHLAVETFFHTRRASPLLADTTDDDFITWFGSDYNNDNAVWKDPEMSTQQHKDELPDMIVLSDLNEDQQFMNEETSTFTPFNIVLNSNGSYFIETNNNFNDIDQDSTKIYSDDTINDNQNENNGGDGSAVSSNRYEKSNVGKNLNKKVKSGSPEVEEDLLNKSGAEHNVGDIHKGIVAKKGFKNGKMKLKGKKKGVKSPGLSEVVKRVLVEPTKVSEIKDNELTTRIDLERTVLTTIFPTFGNNSDVKAVTPHEVSVKENSSQKDESKVENPVATTTESSLLSIVYSTATPQTILHVENATENLKNSPATHKIPEELNTNLRDIEIPITHQTTSQPTLPPQKVSTSS